MFLPLGLHIQIADRAHDAAEPSLLEAQWVRVLHTKFFYLGLASHGAVSYTHLDVYKRQLLTLMTW